MMEIVLVKQLEASKEMRYLEAWTLEGRSCIHALPLSSTRKQITACTYKHHSHLQSPFFFFSCFSILYLDQTFLDNF